MLKTFRKGGIHPPANKTADTGIELLPLPYKAYLPLSQHIGAPARPVVAKGDPVIRGQQIAENPSYVSAGLHAPISGTVTAIEPVVLPSGLASQAIVITADENQHNADTEIRSEQFEEMKRTKADRTLSETFSRDEIRKRIQQAGIVGLGGAAFPSHVKLGVDEKSNVDVLIINGCECEPYLMCDDALMRTCPEEIAEGIEMMMKAVGTDKAVIGIENNKSEAIAAMRSAIDSHSGISVQPLVSKYPQGGEKQLVEAITGRRIAPGALPLSVGAVVNNVATAFAVMQAVAMGKPRIERVITITGDIAPEQRRNYLVAIGTPISELPFTLPSEARVILGGPMMGRTAVRLDAPVTKGTSGVTILSGRLRRPVQPCVRCGMCVEACPMGLEPYLLSSYGRLRMWDEARETHAADCLECGACSYSCPSSRPLLDYIRIAKQRSRK